MQYWNRLTICSPSAYYTFSKLIMYTDVSLWADPSEFLFPTYSNDLSICIPRLVHFLTFEFITRILYNQCGRLRILHLALWPWLFHPNNNISLFVDVSVAWWMIQVLDLFCASCGNIVLQLFPFTSTDEPTQRGWSSDSRTERAPSSSSPDSVVVYISSK